MQHLLMMVAILAFASPLDAAEIRGTVKMTTLPQGFVEAAYEGRTSGGRPVTNMAGLKPSLGPGEVWCDTHKPRRTLLKWDPKEGLVFHHTGLPGGEYLVFVKTGNYVNWKVLDLPDDTATLDTTLAIDTSQTGKLLIEITRGAGDYQAALVPLTADNRLPLDGVKLGRSFHFRVSVDAFNTTTASFDGLRPGHYRVFLRSLKREGSESTGYMTILTDLGMADVKVLAGTKTRVALP